VILDAIVLDNFGVYGGRQEFILTPDQPNRPIILFGGLNGGGKTTFLDAVQLAFYGPKARCSNRGKLAYRDYLRAAIHRNADPSQGAAITIHFRRVIDGETHAYRLLRAWREGDRDVEENVEVSRDGELDAVLTEHWDEFIESYIPSGIAHLFFFDAEQIKDLAEGEHAAELLGTAIHTLLGLDIVERLETDLVTLERRKKSAIRAAGEKSQRFKHAEEELARLDRMQEETTNEKARLNGELIELAKAVWECKKEFKQEGGDLFERRTELESDLARHQKELASEEHTLRELAAGPSPLVLIASLLREAEKQVRREAIASKEQAVFGTLEERDASLLDELRKARTPRTHLKRIETILEKDRNQRRIAMSEPLYLHSDDHLVSELRHLRITVLPEVTSKIGNGLKAAAKLREQVARVETTLARVPAADSIARLQQELKTLQMRHEEKAAEVHSLEAKLQIIVRQRAAAEESVRRVLAEEMEHEFGKEDQDRTLKHSAKVRNTLQRFRTSVIRKHAERIERLMLEAFSQLVRKSSLITHLKIDPQSFRIELTGGDGRLLPFERLSAGERQLLATSLLWGLARASGRPLPTIIDTPLARLDSSHRRHLVERYFPVASHQVILLSTDEEIDEDSHKRLWPHIGRTYHLEFDAKLSSTRATPGYFWNNEAAC
jgi:DNA sulfur modification protein DndD